MAELVKVKGLKGKQNKKKWAKNIDVSALLEAQAQSHTQQLRQLNAPDILISDDSQKSRAPLDPNRFKNVVVPPKKQKYDNRIVRNLGLSQAEDPWSSNYEGKHKYKPAQIPSIIAPESGHSYNPRQDDIEKLKDRVIDYEEIKPVPRKVKAKSQLPTIQVRHRNKKKREAQLAALNREKQKEANRELTSLKKINADLEEKERRIEEGVKTKQIAKERLRKETLTGRVRKGPKLSKRQYRFKEYIPEGERAQQVSKVELKDEAFRDRFDSIYRRGLMQPRNIKVHANRRKNIKVLERAFIE